MIGASFITAILLTTFTTGAAVDIQPPTLTCPSSTITATTTLGQATARVDWSIDVTDDSLLVNPDAKIVVHSSHQPLQEFPIGETGVVVDATDEAGNVAKCSFVIVVVDNEPPVITYCPSDITVADAILPEVRVSWDRPIATDNSGVSPILSSNRQSGDFFAVPGSSEIFYVAEDGSRNRATCSFQITLTKKTCVLYDPPDNGALVCHAIGNDRVCAVMCKSDLDFSFPPPVLYFCSAGKWNYYDVSYIGYQHSTNLPWPDCSAQDAESFLKKNFRDYFFFTGDANDPIVVEGVKSNFYQFLKQPFVLPVFCEEPKCSKESMEVYAGKVLDIQPPTLTCPSSTITATTTIGQATARVDWSINVTDDSLLVNPDAKIVVHSSHQPLQEFPIGETGVVVNATDEAGNVAKCSFVIVVVDDEPPVFIRCTSDINMTDVVESQIRVSWERPNVTDNSGVPVALSSSRQSGDFFSAPGEYEIINTAIDGSDNRATCSFRITLAVKTCTLYDAPKNGALACYSGVSDRVCTVQCKRGFHFTSVPPLFYLCSRGTWSVVGFGSFNLPWPDCTVSQTQQVPVYLPQYYYFDGEANDPDGIADIKSNFVALTSSFPFCPQCTEEATIVYAGEVDI